MERRLQALYHSSHGEPYLIIFYIPNIWAGHETHT